MRTSIKEGECSNSGQVLNVDQKRFDKAEFVESLINYNFL